jgi:transposase
MKQITVNVPALVIGLDLSDERSKFCMMDGRKKIQREGSVEMSLPALKQFFGAIEACRVVLETSGQSAWVAKAIRSCGHEVFVINPRQLELLTKSAKKTDRNDARVLAGVGRLDVELLNPVHEKADVTLAVRVQLRARTQLVRTRTRLINLVRSSMKLFGVRPPKCGPDDFHRKVQLPELVASALEPIVKVLAKLQAEIERYDKVVISQCKKQFPQTEIFRQIHGVGPLVGLTPKKFKSGDSDPNLRISKQGDGAVRSLLVTAATHILRRSAPDTDLKRLGRRLAKSGTKRDKGRARIAVARKLAILMHRMWLTGEVYQPLRAQPA